MNMNAQNTFDQFVQKVAAGLSALPDKPEETPDAALRALWHLAANNPLSVQAAATTPLPDLDPAAHSRLAELIAQRLAGMPLAHLTCRQQFMGLELLAGREALIPRVETELLGFAALATLRNLKQDAPTVVDVCTGSGNLALALAHFESRARVFASDLSPDAVTLARRNAHHLGLGERLEVREGDLLAPFDTPEFHARIDLLVCNPPYISSKKVDSMPSEIIGFEPRLAFDGGPLGIKILQRLIREAPRFLRSGGSLAFEVGLGQGPALLKRLSSNDGFRRVRTVEDQNGEIRAILADAT
jgi:release factor glutamine methyltransferase